MRIITSEKGMILLITSVMLMVITLFVLSLMQAIISYYRLTNQIQMLHVASERLEQSAYQLANGDLRKVSSACRLNTEDPNDMTRLLQQHQGCVLNPFDYYLVADLGLQPCLEIKQGKQSFISHQWLVGVISFTPKKKMVQLRIATPEKATPCMSSQRVRIHPGIISWRAIF